MGTQYYDRHGRPITVCEWARLMERGAHLVGIYERDGVTVSTAWLGLNHNWGGGQPLIFETMIFGGPHDQFQRRWTTEAEAKSGHAKIVKAIQDGVDPEVAIKDRETPPPADSAPSSAT